MRAPAKRMAKSLIGEGLIRTGLWHRRLRTWAHGEEVVILTFHRVIQKWDSVLDYSQPGLVVTAETFDLQLRFLKEQFDIVPLSSLIAERRIHRSALRPRSVLTFDDGWRDNYDIALPILRKHGVPATVFLTTDFIGTNRAFWHTELSYLLLHDKVSQLTKDQHVFRAYPTPVRIYLTRLSQMRQPPCAQNMDSLIESLKEECNDAAIGELIQDLANALCFRMPLFPGRRFFLNWDEVHEMAAAGIEIGSHGCSHRILTRLKVEEAEEELVRSKAELEGRIGHSVQHFAFPNGAANRDLMALVGKARYRTACLDADNADEGQFGPLALRRVGMHEGVSVGSDGSFSEGPLLLWLFRAPTVRVT